MPPGPLCPLLPSQTGLLSRSGTHTQVHTLPCACTCVWSHVPTHMSPDHRCKGKLSWEHSGPLLPAPTPPPAPTLSKSPSSLAWVPALSSHPSLAGARPRVWAGGPREGRAGSQAPATVSEGWAGEGHSSQLGAGPPALTHPPAGSLWIPGTGSTWCPELGWAWSEWAPSVPAQHRAGGRARPCGLTQWKKKPQLRLGWAPSPPTPAKRAGPQGVIKGGVGLPCASGRDEKAPGCCAHPTGNLGFRAGGGHGSRGRLCIQGFRMRAGLLGRSDPQGRGWEAGTHNLLSLLSMG